MKELVIHEMIEVVDSKIQTTFEYVSGSAKVYYRDSKINYIELSSNEIALLNNTNKIVNSENGRVYRIQKDFNGRIETIEVGTKEIESKTYTISANDEGVLETKELVHRAIIERDNAIEEDFLIGCDEHGRLLTDEDVKDAIATTLNQALEGKSVVVEYVILVENKSLVVAKNNRFDSLFYAYSTETLKHNHMYEYNVNVKNKDFKIDFVSKLDPFYSSVSKVRSDTGELLSNVADDTISYLIYTNSKIAYEILTDSEVEGVPTYAKQYVRYKTDMDLINAAYLSLSGRVGSVSKQIGIINVDKTYKIPYVKDMLYYFKDLMKKYEDMLNEAGGSNVVGSFIKAGSTSYPIDSRNNF